MIIKAIKLSAIDFANLHYGTDVEKNLNERLKGAIKVDTVHHNYGDVTFLAQWPDEFEQETK